MQVVTKDGNYNAVLKLNLSIDLLKGAETEVLVDVLVNGVKVINGYKVTTVQSNMRPWPENKNVDMAELVEAYLLLDTQDKKLPDETSADGIHYTNIVETRVADSNYPMTIKVVPTQPGHNVMISNGWLTEIQKITAINESGQTASFLEEISHQLRNPIRTDGFIWTTVVNPDVWEYTITK